MSSSRGRKRRAPGQTTLLGDSKPQQRQPQHAEGAKRLPSPAQMIDAAFRRQTAAHAPVIEMPEPERHTGPERILGTPAIPDGGRAVFSPKDPNRQTGAMPALGDPYAAQPAEVAPAIFKAVTASRPPAEPVPVPELEPPVLVEEEPYCPEKGPRIEFYTQPGWAFLPTSQSASLKKDMDAIVAQGYGRNLTGILTAFQYARQGVARCARELCATLGQPEMTHMLLRRVEHFNATETPDQIRAALGLDADGGAS